MSLERTGFYRLIRGDNHTFFRDDSRSVLIQSAYIICCLPLAFAYLTLQQFAQTSFALQADLYDRVAALTNGNEGVEFTRLSCSQS